CIFMSAHSMRPPGLNRRGTYFLKNACRGSISTRRRRDGRRSSALPALRLSCEERVAVNLKSSREAAHPTRGVQWTHNGGTADGCRIRFGGQPIIPMIINQNDRPIATLAGI